MAEDDLVDGGPEPPRPGALRWFVGTTFRAFYRPTEFFRSLPASEGYGTPLVYAILMGWLVALLGLVEMMFEHGTSGMARAEIIKECLTPPVYALVEVFLASAVIHVAGLALRCSAGGYSATFKAYAYSAAGGVLTVLPVIGEPLAIAWAAVITVIGLRELHGSTTLRAALAVILAVLAILALAALFVLPFA